MATTITSPSGKVLHHRATRNTTPKNDTSKKVVKIPFDKNNRLQENNGFLKNKNVKAFLQAIADAEGGGYDFKYGAVKGKRNDPWRFDDYTTHPGAGLGGKTTAAGLYQITIETWRDKSSLMGLNDFTPETQDLIAVELLRKNSGIEKLIAGDIDSALPDASFRWAALPQGPGLANRYNQPYMKYEVFCEHYAEHGGTKK